MNNIDLVKVALEAQKNSYSPYSKFAVGAAILTEDDKVFSGCNIENAAFGPSVCAERTALFSAIANGYNKFKKIAIVGGKLKNFAFPCGVCRQVLSEFSPNIEVIVAKYNNKNEIVMESHNLKELLPCSFGSDALN